MSTLIQYLVVVKDFPGTKQKRIEIREQHLAAAKTNTAVKVGGMQSCPLRVPVSFPRTILTVGAIFSKDPTPEDPLPFAVPSPLGPPIHYFLEFRVLSGVYGCHTCVHLTDYLF